MTDRSGRTQINHTVSGGSPESTPLTIILAEMLRSALAWEKANGRTKGEPNDDGNGGQKH